MKMVPNKTTGSSRRSYQRGYAKSGDAQASQALGSAKVRSAPIKPAKAPKAVKIDTGEPKAASALTPRGYGKTPALSPSFGTTGFTDEEFNR
jgi:hypothetical protein